MLSEFGLLHQFVLPFPFYTCFGLFICARLPLISSVLQRFQGHEESVEDFVRRNLGDEVFERLIEPFCSGSQNVLYIFYQMRVQNVCVRKCKILFLWYGDIDFRKMVKLVNLLLWDFPSHSLCL